MDIHYVQFFDFMMAAHMAIYQQKGCAIPKADISERKHVMLHIICKLVDLIPVLPERQSDCRASLELGRDQNTG